MAAVPKSPDKERSVVAQDKVWRSHVNKEQLAAKMWPEEWGFLTTQYTEMQSKETEQSGKVRLEIPAHLRIRPSTPVEEYIKVDPSPAVPQTTQGLIGWRSSMPSLQLERYGISRHKKGDFCKTMKWPAEGMA